MDGLRSHEVRGDNIGQAEEQPSLLMNVCLMVPTLLLIAVWIFFMRQMQGSRVVPFHLASQKSDDR